MKEQTIQTLTENRVALDGIEQTIQKLPKNRYTSLASTALELGRMYAGEVCFELGKDYPYEKTKKATKPSEIEAAVDLFTGVINVGEEIPTINALRGVIDDINNNSLNTIIELMLNSPAMKVKDKFVIDCNISQMYRSLKEARMWLGKRLGEIRDIDANKTKTN